MNISFNRRTDLALSALRVLADTAGRMSRTELARSIGTTPSFLAQVMPPLVQEGWVVSERGPGGGYEITDAAFQARLIHVVETTEGPTTNGRCVLRDGACPGTVTCPIHSIWSEARQTLVEGLDALPALQEQGDTP